MKNTQMEYPAYNLLVCTQEAYKFWTSHSEKPIIQKTLDEVRNIAKWILADKEDNKAVRIYGIFNNKQTLVEELTRDDLNEPPEERTKGKWLNGRHYEYEYAYCSKCGHMEYAGWNSHAEAREAIVYFHKHYRFCPWCGTKMEGGQYVERKGTDNE